MHRPNTPWNVVEPGLLQHVSHVSYNWLPPYEPVFLVRQMTWMLCKIGSLYNILGPPSNALLSIMLTAYSGIIAFQRRHQRPCWILGHDHPTPNESRNNCTKHPTSIFQLWLYTHETFSPNPNYTRQAPATALDHTYTQRLKSFTSNYRRQNNHHAC